MKPYGLPRKSACTCAYHRFLEGQMTGRKRARQHAKTDLRAQVREAEAALTARDADCKMPGMRLIRSARGPPRGAVVLFPLRSQRLSLRKTTSMKTYPFASAEILAKHTGRSSRTDFLCLHYLRGNPASVPEPTVAPGNEPSVVVLVPFLEKLLDRQMTREEVESLRTWCKVEESRLAVRPKRRPGPRPNNGPRPAAASAAQ